MIFNAVKIEKLLGLPEVPEPNRLYLVESKDQATKFYLSDSKGVLWLLNEQAADVNYNVNGEHVISETTSKFVYENAGATGVSVIFLPTTGQQAEMSFYIADSDGIIIVAQYDTSIVFGDVESDVNGIVKSDIVGSFVCLRAIQGKWVVRYSTGLWELDASIVVTYGSETVTYGGVPVYYF